MNVVRPIPKVTCNDQLLLTPEIEKRVKRRMKEQRGLTFEEALAQIREEDLEEDQEEREELYRR